MANETVGRRRRRRSASTGLNVVATAAAGAAHVGFSGTAISETVLKTEKKNSTKEEGGKRSKRRFIPNASRKKTSKTRTATTDE